ncbi:MAG: DnaD domain-containing protein [Bacillota bacterium]
MKQKDHKLISNYFHFVQEFLTQTTAVPDLLLQNYSQLALSDSELVFFLRLLMQTKNLPYFNLEDIKAAFADDNHKVEEMLELFSNKGLISADNEAGEGYYSLQGFFHQLWEIWCYEKSCSKSLKKPIKTVISCKKEIGKTLRQDFAVTYKMFERELGRGLSPIESEKIAKWFDEDKFSPELIKEALKRAVLQGKPYFNYIDKILVSWKSQNLHTIAEIQAKDNYSYHRKTSYNKNQKKAAPKCEYSAIYDKILKP